ncbi:MAG: hypothetical protein WD971_02750 [Pirellulales bacterium]
MSDFDSSVKFCCSIFRDKISIDECRGMTIVPHRHARFGPYFVLIFRAVASQDEGQLLNIGRLSLTLKVDQAIRYCPWCGKKLDDHYREYFDKLPAVVDQFIDTPETDST